MSLHVLAKPTGARCNLACAYCFYLGREALYPGGRFRMTETMAERYVEESFAHHGDEPVVPLAWQGGEPTLMGLPFFRHALAHARARLRPGQRIELTFQTNGVLLDDAWCAWLAAEGALVGLSIDGPPALHDAFRRDPLGGGTAADVERAARRLLAHGAAVNAMVCVHAANAAAPREVYRYLVDTLGFRHIQLLPVVEPEGGGVSGRSVTPAAWGTFLCSLFDLWVDRDVGTVFVGHFDAALAAWAGLPSPMCVFRETCGEAVVLEHQGDVYACDHFVAPEWRLGNLGETSIDALAASPVLAAFGAAKRDTLPARCRACDVRFACHGECPKNRLLADPDGARNWLCEGFYRFFRHVDPDMRTMARLRADGRPVPAIMALRRFARTPPPPRTPCPCESGLRYERCHGS